MKTEKKEEPKKIKEVTALIDKAKKDGNGVVVMVIDHKEEQISMSVENVTVDHLMACIKGMLVQFKIHPMNVLAMFQPSQAQKSEKTIVPTIGLTDASGKPLK